MRSTASNRSISYFWPPLLTGKRRCGDRTRVETALLAGPQRHAGATRDLHAREEPGCFVKLGPTGLLAHRTVNVLKSTHGLVATWHSNVRILAKPLFESEVPQLAYAGRELSGKYRTSRSEKEVGIRHDRPQANRWGWVEYPEHIRNWKRPSDRKSIGWKQFTGLSSPSEAPMNESTRSDFRAEAFPLRHGRRENGCAEIAPEGVPGNHEVPIRTSGVMAIPAKTRPGRSRVIDTIKLVRRAEQGGPDGMPRRGIQSVYHASLDRHSS